MEYRITKGTRSLQDIFENELKDIYTSNIDIQQYARISKDISSLEGSQPKEIIATDGKLQKAEKLFGLLGLSYYLESDESGVLFSNQIEQQIQKIRDDFRKYQNELIYQEQ